MDNNEPIKEIITLFKRLKVIKIILVFILLSLLVINFYNIFYPRNEAFSKTEKLLIENQHYVEQIQNEIEYIHNQIKVMTNKVDSLKDNNRVTIKRYQDEIKNFEWLVKNSSDSLYVNSILRYWTNRIQELPDFFQ